MNDQRLIFSEPVPNVIVRFSVAVVSVGASVSVGVAPPPLSLVVVVVPSPPLLPLQPVARAATIANERTLAITFFIKFPP